MICGKYARLFHQDGEDAAEIMMNFLIKQGKLYFNSNESWLFSPSCLFLKTGPYKRELQPGECWIHHRVQDILTRYSFPPACRSWLPPIGSILGHQGELINFSWWKNEYVSLSGHKIAWSYAWEGLGGIPDDHSLMVGAFRWVSAGIIKFQLQMRQNKMHLELSLPHCKIVLLWDIAFKVNVLPLSALFS